MSSALSDIAEITGLRDRQRLDVSVAESLFRRLAARSLSLWSIRADGKQRRARLLASVQRDAPVRMLDPLIGPLEWPRVDEGTPLDACCQRRALVQVESPDRGRLRSFVPVGEERLPNTVIEIDHGAPLDADQLAQLEDVLRIYRNQIALLDYSERDTLTGLNNRKTFDDAFERCVRGEWKVPAGSTSIEYVGRRRALRPGDVPWLAVMDIDFFKRINDKFGHVFGDEVLLLTSQLMRASFRHTDLLFRFGGEEFVVVLQRTDPVGARTAFEHFRTRIEQHDFPQVGKVSVSVGYGAVRASDPPDGVFERADAALYYAKQNGRNRSCCFEDLVRSGALEDKSAQAQGDIELF